MTEKELKSFDPNDAEHSGLEFVDEQERILFAEAQLGYAIADWMNSDVGRYLQGRAKIEADEAKTVLAEINYDAPDALSKAKAAQQRIEICRRVMLWCAEAMHNGEHAETELETYRS